MAEYVGIDLGTTLSGLAYLKPDGNPEIVPNSDGERLTPSVVFFEGHEDVKLVGSAARDGGEPDRTVFQIKRHMDDPEYLVKIDDKNWTPSEISALILSKLKRDALAKAVAKSLDGAGYLPDLLVTPVAHGALIVTADGQAEIGSIAA